MWTPSCARCCWRRRSSINRRRVRVHGPPPNGCRQHAEAAAARKLRAAPILPAVRVRGGSCSWPAAAAPHRTFKAPSFAPPPVAPPPVAPPPLTPPPAVPLPPLVAESYAPVAAVPTAAPQAPLRRSSRLARGCQRRVRPCTTPSSRRRARLSSTKRDFVSGFRRIQNSMSQSTGSV